MSGLRTQAPRHTPHGTFVGDRAVRPPSIASRPSPPEPPQPSTPTPFITSYRTRSLDGFSHCLLTYLFTFQILFRLLVSNNIFCIRVVLCHTTSYTLLPLVLPESQTTGNHLNPDSEQLNHTSPAERDSETASISRSSALHARGARLTIH